MESSRTKNKEESQVLSPNPFRGYHAVPIKSGKRAISTKKERLDLWVENHLEPNSLRSWKSKTLPPKRPSFESLQEGGIRRKGVGQARGYLRVWEIRKGGKVCRNSAVKHRGGAVR